MKNLVKYITAIVIFLFLLTSCEKTPSLSSTSTLTPLPTSTLIPTPTFSPVRDTDVTPTPTVTLLEPTMSPIPPEPTSDITPEVTPEITPDITNTPTSTPLPTATPTPDIVITPAPDPVTLLRECTFINYSNGLPFAMTHTGSAEFSYDDEITLENKTGEIVTLYLSECIISNDYDFSDPDSWFFCGAFQYEEMIYAHYDYFDEDNHSLLLKINPETFDIKLCIISTNPRKQFSDTFVAVGEYIYYLHTTYSSYGTPTSSIYRTDLDGNHSERWFKGNFNETISHMSTNGTLLYYITIDSDKVSRLTSIDPVSKEQNVIAKKIATVDFLYLLGNYAVTSLKNNRIAYYNVKTKVAAELNLSISSSLTTSSPMTDGCYMYIPVFSYSGSSNTRLIKVDLALSRVIDDIIVSDTFYYCLGMIEQTLYTENGNEYQIFQLDE